MSKQVGGKPNYQRRGSHAQFNMVQYPGANQSATRAVFGHAASVESQPNEQGILKVGRRLLTSCFTRSFDSEKGSTGDWFGMELVGGNPQW